MDNYHMPIWKSLFSGPFLGFKSPLTLSYFWQYLIKVAQGNYFLFYFKLQNQRFGWKPSSGFDTFSKTFRSKIMTERDLNCASKETTIRTIKSTFKHKHTLDTHSHLSGFPSPLRDYACCGVCVYEKKIVWVTYPLCCHDITPDCKWYNASEFDKAWRQINATFRVDKSGFYRFSSESATHLSYGAGPVHTGEVSLLFPMNDESIGNPVIS